MEKDNKWKEYPSFFCSELVAGAYMSAGIVEPTKSAANFFPGDYANDSSIDFKKGFRLGPEYIIDFTL